MCLGGLSESRSVPFGIGREGDVIGDKHDCDNCESFCKSGALGANCGIVDFWQDGRGLVAEPA
jgi:hypothetical protein